MPERLQAIRAFCGRVGIAFVILTAVALVLPDSGRFGVLNLVARWGALLTAAVLLFRLVRILLRKLVWRLRNRILVTYLFIAVVPIVLVVAFAAVGAMTFFTQSAIFLVTNELNRRVDILAVIAENIATTPGTVVAQTIERPVGFLRTRVPGAIVLFEEGGRVERFLQNDSVPVGPPPRASGIFTRNGTEAFLSGYASARGREVSVVVPLTREVLETLAPDLGVVIMGRVPQNGPFVPGVSAGRVPASGFPRLLRFLDPELFWFATVPAKQWDGSADLQRGVFVGVQSRPSALLVSMFARRSDFGQSVLVTILFVLAGLFVFVEVVSLWIGVRLTRTMTGAVHLLYEGTERVREGDFSHRIQARGDDQLADLSRSFNRMTENVERLLSVSKEKERLQSELEIGREVQARLYPTQPPACRTLQIQGTCQPARVVSGDYFDYEVLPGGRVAVAMGDVAGKGVSAALLMASLQSSLRSQIHQNRDGLSPSEAVARINLQLHINTGPEKYATFCFGVIEETTGIFTYTNAGHLPPLLVRDAQARKLEINGTVVGAFSSAQYSESRLQLQSGDLLVFYTDGVSEPENLYGEMFGEERLTELVTRDAQRPLADIISSVGDAVREWTGAGELQDDLTLLLVRRL